MISASSPAPTVTAQECNIAQLKIAEVLGFAVIFTLHVKGQRQFNSIFPNAVNTKAEPFRFSYKVNNEGNDHSHGAESDGSKVTGEYQVLLPDGRRQKVTYIADDTGYRAFIQYEGEATIPRSPFSMSTRNPRSWEVTPTTEDTGNARFKFIENQQDVNLVSQTVFRSPQNQMNKDFDSGRQTGFRSRSRQSARPKKVVMKVVHPNSEGGINDSQSQYKVSPTTRNGRRMKKMVVYKVIPPNSTRRGRGNQIEQYEDDYKSNTESTTSGFGIYKPAGEQSQVISNYQLLLTSPTTPRTWGSAYTVANSEVESWKIKTTNSRNSVQSKLTELTQEAEKISNPDVRGSNTFSDNTGFRYDNFTTISPTTVRQPVRNSKRRNNLGNNVNLHSYNNGFSSTPQNYYSAPPTTGRPPAFERNNVNNLSENNEYRNGLGTFYTVPSTTERQQVSYDTFSQSNVVENYKFSNIPESIHTSFPVTEKKSDMFNSLKESNVDNAPENNVFIIRPETFHTASPTANRESPTNNRYNSFGRGDIVENNNFSNGLQRLFTASPVIEQNSERYNSLRGSDVNNVQENNGFSIRPERLHTVSPPTERQPSNTLSRNKVDTTSGNDEFNIRPEKLNAASPPTERQPKRYNSLRRSNVDNVQGNNVFSNSPERVLTTTPSSRRQPKRYNSLRRKQVDKVQHNNDSNIISVKLHSTVSPTERQSSRYNSFNRNNVDSTSIKNEFNKSHERFQTSSPSSEKELERSTAFRRSKIDSTLENNGSTVGHEILPSTTERQTETNSAFKRRNANTSSRKQYISRRKQMQIESSTTFEQPERYETFRGSRTNIKSQSNDSINMPENDRTVSPTTEEQKTSYNNFRRRNFESNYRQKRARTTSNTTSAPPSNEVRKIRGRISFRDSSSVNTAQLHSRRAIVNTSKIDEREINYGIKNLTISNNGGTLSRKWSTQGDTIEITNDDSMNVSTTTEAQCANCTVAEDASEDQILPPNDTRKVVKRSSDYIHRQHKSQDHSHFRRG